MILGWKWKKITKQYHNNSPNFTVIFASGQNGVLQMLANADKERKEVWPNADWWKAPRCDYLSLPLVNSFSFSLCQPFFLSFLELTLNSIYGFNLFILSFLFPLFLYVTLQISQAWFCTTSVYRSEKDHLCSNKSSPWFDASVVQKIIWLYGKRLFSGISLNQH